MYTELVNVSTAVAVELTVVSATAFTLSPVDPDSAFANNILYDVTLRFGSLPLALTTTFDPSTAAVNDNRSFDPVLTTPYVDINAVVPSCTTNASMLVTSVFDALLTEI